MDSYPSIEDPALVPDRTLTPLYTLFNNNLLRPVISIEGTKILLRGAYHGFQNLVSDYIGTHPASGIATSETIDLNSQPGHNHQIENSVLEPPVNTPEHRLNNHNPSDNVSEYYDAETASQPASDEGNRSERALPTSSRRVKMWVAILIVGVTSLIVVPGLILGVVTKQLPWGIALCGLIATVISFYASFYYHLDKRD